MVHFGVKCTHIVCSIFDVGTSLATLGTFVLVKSTELA